nr:hypothetical protein [Planctomycetales bacterium]
MARSLYQAWLLELVNHVGLVGPSIDSSEPVATKSGYHLLSFSVRGNGTLEQLTKFLFEFYNAVHLHQISSLNITPKASIDELELFISIDALAVPGAADKDGNPRKGQLASRDQLSSPWSGRLASANLDDYRLIADRNVFGIGGSPNAIEHTFLDG